MPDSFKKVDSVDTRLVLGPFLETLLAMRHPLQLDAQILSLKTIFPAISKYESMSQSIL